MSGERWRTLRLIAAGVVVLSTATLLVAVWRSPHQSDLAVYGAFAFPVVVCAVGLIERAYRSKDQPSSLIDVSALEIAADQLAIAVKTQWARAAGERGLLLPEPISVRWCRPSQVLTGPTSAATSSQRFPPLPGLNSVEVRQLTHGKVADLHNLYGGLGSGRLVIAGPPGAGKSGAAVLLVLAAVTYREQATPSDRPKVPVPVILTLNGWDPEKQLAQNWIIARLQETYPMFAGKRGVTKAGGLLAAGMLTLILDGLDEVPRDLRSVALRALSQQATFRLVILTRSGEMADAATHGMLDGAAAIELQNVSPTVAAGYLRRVQVDPPPEGWNELVRRLRDNHERAIAGALSSPLALTLVRDTYRQGDDVRELLDFCDRRNTQISAQDIIDHLLDRVLPAAYAQRPGEPMPAYSFESAEKFLTRLAQWMNRGEKRDLEWWQLRRVVPFFTRNLLMALANALIGMTCGEAVVIIYTLAILLPGHHFTEIQPSTFIGGAICGALVGAVLGMVGILVFGMESRTPFYAGTVSFRRVFLSSSFMVETYRGLVRGLVRGTVSGATVGVALWLIAVVALHGQLGGIKADIIDYFTIGAITGGSLGIILGPVIAIDRALTQPQAGKDNPLSPAESWRGDRNYGFLMGLVTWTFIMLVAFLVGAFTKFGGHPFTWLAIATTIALGFGAAVNLTYPATWGGQVAFCYLRVRWKTPLRLMRFLEDAKDRGVLRTVGPAYQFRHARLQDRLAMRASFRQDS